MSLLDAIGGGLTAATDVAAGQQRGDTQGSQLLRAIGMQQAQMGHLNAETASNNARADWYKSRVPSEAATQNLRESLVNAGNDPDDVDAAIAASRSGDHSGLKSLFAAPPKGPTARILRTPTGYVSVTPGGGDPAAPVLGPDGKPVMPIIAPPRSVRAPNPNIEDPAHRNTRQALGAVRAQVNDASGQLRAMDRSAPPLIQNPGIITGTPSDSADANQFRQNRAALQQRTDSLRGVSDQLAGSMSRAAGAVGGGSRTIRQPLTATQRARAASNPDYKQFLTDK